MTTRADIVTEARTWVGTRWQHQAMRKGIGADCIGLVAGVAYALDLADARPEARPPEFNGYGRQPKPEVLLAACVYYLDPIGLEYATTGDVLVMRFTADPQHMAIVSRRDPDYIIHAYAQARKVVENGLDALWRSRICSAWRFRGID